MICMRVCCGAVFQGMEAAPLEGVPRYLAASIALFEVVDDDLLPIKPLGIQVSSGAIYGKIIR